MSEQRDPVLDALFAGAEQLPAEDAFTDQVMGRVEHRRRNVLAGRLSVLLLLIALEVLLEAPVNQSLGALTGMLGTELIDAGESLPATILAPVNSVAGLLGLGLIGLHALFRKLSR